MTKRVGRLLVVAAIGMFLVGALPQTQFACAATTDAEEKLGQAGQFGKRGDYSAAVRLATEVIQEQPTYALAYLVRGTAHRRAGDYARAIADFDQSIELDSQQSYAYTQRAFACQQSHEGHTSKQIIADLNRAIELDSNNSLARILRGNEFAALDRHEAAITEYDQALRRNPKSHNALAGRALSKLKLGRVDDARRDLQKALECDPPTEDRIQIEAALKRMEALRK